jgi:hypothetical protein
LTERKIALAHAEKAAAWINIDGCKSALMVLNNSGRQFANALWQEQVLHTSASVNNALPEIKVSPKLMKNPT